MATNGWLPWRRSRSRGGRAAKKWSARRGVSEFESDFAEIGRYLAEQGLPEEGSTPDPIQSSEAALEEVRRLLTGELVLASSAVDALLDLWSAVHLVDPAAAEPVERVLPEAANQRWVSAEELISLCDQTTAALAQARSRLKGRVPEKGKGRLS